VWMHLFIVFYIHYFYDVLSWLNRLGQEKRLWFRNPVISYYYYYYYYHNVRGLRATPQGIPCLAPIHCREPSALSQLSTLK